VKKSEMTNSTIQIRGNCQCCGHQQAVVSGTMSKHGYTVEHGWFSGVCSGRNYAPMQVSREHTDAIVAQVRAEVPQLIAQADKVKAGEITPATIKIRKGGEKMEVAYADASLSQQSQARDSMEWSLRNRARAGEQFANDMESLATKIHGTALIEVAKKEAPSFIMPRDQKVDAQGFTCTCTSVDGARVYYKYEKNGSVYKTWMGSQAWRKMATV
jgi:hypothetical protein